MHVMTKSFRRAAALLCGILATTSCESGGTTGPNTTAVASVSITPPTSTLGTTKQAVLEAAALDAAGNVLSGRTIVWSSSNLAVVTVANGTITGVAPGTAMITAATGNRSGIASITVRHEVDVITNG